MTEKARYTDEELEKFRSIIVAMRDKAQKDYDFHVELMRGIGNGIDDTSPRVKLLEGHADDNSRENNAKLAKRQKELVDECDASIIRINKKEYGICARTKQLIPVVRLFANPNALCCV